jgi:hypothetical protein
MRSSRDPEAKPLRPTPGKTPRENIGAGESQAPGEMAGISVNIDMADTDFPRIHTRLPEMMAFVSDLAQDYESGHIPSWQMMDEKVHAFFTPDMLDEVNAIAPGWREMSSYDHGVTLVHVMCAFTGLLTSPEYHQALRAQQELMKWIVLFHDLAKEVRNGQRDFTHAFRSAAKTGAILPRVGFAATAEYGSLIDGWIVLTDTAITKRGKTSPVRVQDNSKLPEILDGIERLFGHTSPATLIVKTVLLHLSINVIEEWPQPAPLTETEIRQYVDTELFPLVRMMMLADNDGWTLFDQATKERYRQETLAVFRELEPFLAE